MTASPAAQADLGEVFATVANEVALDAAIRSISVHDASSPLHDLVISVAGNYANHSRQAEFQDARRLRAAARDMTSKTYRPGELADLYVVSGQATALMASLAFDLGHWEPAKKLVVGATEDALMAGHASLVAWTLGLHATLLFWDGRPRDALQCVGRALQDAPAGLPQFRLHNIAARAHAVAGDPAGVLNALQAASDAREVAEGKFDPMHDGVGGEFGFDDVRAAACAAAAWLALEDGSRAEGCAIEALERYASLPGAKPMSTIYGTQIDVASARLLQRDIDGADRAARSRTGTDTGSSDCLSVRTGSPDAEHPWSRNLAGRQVGEGTLGHAH